MAVEDQEPDFEATDDDEVTTFVCVKCGEEYYFSDEVPDDLRCEQCGGTTFRPFHSPDGGDEVAADFRESTERDTSTDEASTDIEPGDLADLRRL